MRLHGKTRSSQSYYAATFYAFERRGTCGFKNYWNVMRLYIKLINGLHLVHGEQISKIFFSETVTILNSKCLSIRKTH